MNPVLPMLSAKFGMEVKECKYKPYFAMPPEYKVTVKLTTQDEFERFGKFAEDVHIKFATDAYSLRQLENNPTGIHVSDLKELVRQMPNKESEREDILRHLTNYENGLTSNGLNLEDPVGLYF